MTHDPYELIKATEKLPSPKGIALEILRLTEDDHTTIEDISRVIESDPALSLKLLKIVNSPVTGTSANVASITRATILLGFRTVASLALGLSLVSDNRNDGCAAFDYDAFWSESLARAVAASYLAKQTKSFSADEAFTCALLSQIGRLAFAGAYPKRYADILRFIEDDKDALANLEVELFGINHHALAAEMMADWHLPKMFIVAVRMGRNLEATEENADARTQEFAKLLHLSGVISEVVMGSTADPVNFSILTREALDLGIDQDALKEALESIRNEWHDAGRIFSIPTKDAPSFEMIVARCAIRHDELLIVA